MVTLIMMQHVIAETVTDIENEKVNEITADDIDNIISEMDYEFKNSGDFQIVDTEICGINE